jgi:hypothetical protein
MHLWIWFCLCFLQGDTIKLKILSLNRTAFKQLPECLWISVYKLQHIVSSKVFEIHFFVALLGKYMKWVPKVSR